MSHDKKNIIIYNTAARKASASLYAKNGMVWMNRAEPFDTSGSGLLIPELS